MKTYNNYEAKKDNRHHIATGKDIAAAYIE